MMAVFGWMLDGGTLDRMNDELDVLTEDQEKTNTSLEETNDNLKEVNETLQEIRDKVEKWGLRTQAPDVTPGLAGGLRDLPSVPRDPAPRLRTFVESNLPRFPGDPRPGPQAPPSGGPERGLPPRRRRRRVAKATSCVDAVGGLHVVAAAGSLWRPVGAWFA